MAALTFRLLAIAVLVPTRLGMSAANKAPRGPSFSKPMSYPVGPDLRGLPGYGSGNALKIVFVP